MQENKPSVDHRESVKAALDMVRGHKNNQTRQWNLALDAMRTQGAPVFVDLGFTDQSAATIEVVAAVLDADRATKWATEDGLGDCYFATVDAMLSMVEKGAALNWSIVTGVFAPLGEHPVHHAWLEYRGTERVVVNVSNAATRPIYSMSRQHYASTNLLDHEIERITLDTFVNRRRNQARKENGNLKAGISVDVRTFTKSLLRRTLYAAGNAQTQREGKQAT